MSYHKLKVVVFSKCLDCNRKCEQTAQDLQVCLFYNRKEGIKDIDTILNEQLKDNIKFHILWFLDNEKCDIALTKAKDLSKAVDKIIDEIKASIDN